MSMQVFLKNAMSTRMLKMMMLSCSQHPRKCKGFESHLTQSWFNPLVHDLQELLADAIPGMKHFQPPSDWKEKKWCPQLSVWLEK